MSGKSLLLLLFSVFLWSCGGDKKKEAAPAIEQSDRASDGEGAKAPQYNEAYDRLLNADLEPEQWMTLGRDYGETHYSPLAQINEETVSEIGFAWEFKTGTTRGLEATPIIIDGVLYASGNWGAAYAVNAATGEAIWTFQPDVNHQYARYSCCDIVNRGVAVWDGMVYVAALDGVLYGLNAKSGDVVWKVDTLTDKKRAYSVTGAPRIAGDVVVIGNSGADMDARGYISAYDIKNGDLKWRFYTVPGDPKKGFEHPELEWAAKTWDPDSRWDVGLGGTVWDSMVYDPVLNLLYVGTGNGALYNRAERSPSGGDNLFLASILAINPDTGRLVWHYQETPGESWDYTATQNIILTTLHIDGVDRDVILHAPKNGFFYVIDRTNGELISAEPFVPVTWAERIDLETGRPVFAENADYDKQPRLIAPSAAGGHNWHPMAYNPETGLVYIPAVEMAMVMFDMTPDRHVYKPASSNMGVSMLLADDNFDALARMTGLPSLNALGGKELNTKPIGYLRAWDPIEQKMVWERTTKGFADNAGVLTTGGNIVVQGSSTGILSFYRADTGEILKRIDVGTSIMAAPAAYMIDGEQYIAVLAGEGGALRFQYYRPYSAAYKYGNEGRILAFKLGGGMTPKPDEVNYPDIPKPPALTATERDVQKGSALFAERCAVCHFNQGRGGATPNLLHLSPERHELFEGVVMEGWLQSRGMPRFDDVFSAEDVSAIQAYIISEANKSYTSPEKKDAIINRVH